MFQTTPQVHLTHAPSTPNTASPATAFRLCPSAREPHPLPPDARRRRRHWPGQVWELWAGGGRCAGTLRGHVGAVHAALGLGPVDLLSASADGTICAWHRDGGGVGEEAGAGGGWSCTQVVCVAPGRRGPAAAAAAAAACPARLLLRGADLVSRSVDGAVRAWDPASLRRRRGPAVRLASEDTAVTAASAAAPAGRLAGPMLCCGPAGGGGPGGTRRAGGGMWLVAGVGRELAVLGRT